MKKYLLVALLLTLSACSPQMQIGEADCLNRMVYENGKVIKKKCDDFKMMRRYNSDVFSIETPGDLFAFTKQEPLSFSCEKDACEITLAIHTEQAQRCSPTLTGSWQMQTQETNGATVQWGKVDFFEKFNSGEGWIDYDGERPVCAQPATANARYTFCAEKDGKTVVICINQMTDNPEQAKEIFETFRWVK